jgi:hypothetical protein
MVSAMGSPEQTCRALEDLPMRAGKAGGGYNELWLQELIQAHPALLPIAEIEPGLAAPVPVCLELSVPSGYVDNLMITSDGGVVVVETKLWRNPEARREVVGQILDYAKDLSRFSYETLERAVALARREAGFKLFPLVCPDAEPEAEARFIDAVSRNLRLGRFLLVIAGDGVQESAEQLGDFLQRHIGLHFTLAMVEMSLWRSPGGDVLVQPRILAKTVQIERAVVRLEEGVGLVPVRIEPVAAAASKPITLSAETYYEELARTDAALPARLKAFFAEAEGLGVFPDVKRTLSVKWRSPEGREFLLGMVDREGGMGTDSAHSAAQAIGRIDLSHAYQDRLAALVPGAAVRKTPKDIGWRVVVGDRNLPVAALLDHQDGWLAAIADYVQALWQAMELA